MKIVVLKSVLYFLIAALPAIAAGLHECLTGGQHFSGIYLAWVLVSGFASGCIAIKAYLDVSAAPHLGQGSPSPWPSPPGEGKTTVAPLPEHA